MFASNQSDREVEHVDSSNHRYRNAENYAEKQNAPRMTHSKEGQLQVLVRNAQNLQNVERFGYSDPHVILELDGTFINRIIQ